MMRKIILAVLLFAYILFLLDIALLRFPSTHPAPNFVPFRTILSDWAAGWKEFVVNFIGNIVAFLPMGLIPTLILGRWIKLWHVVLFGLSLSLAIEGGQYLSGRRVTDVDDLILNTVGTLLGYTWVARQQSRRGLSLGQVEKSNTEPEVIA
jgi:glycopeptide antibiotics resistance protein